MKILALSGSVRAASTNTAFLQALANCSPEGVEVEVFHGIGALPIFSEDLQNPRPFAVQMFAEKLAVADALLISSPEYVHAIPGGLKNAIDWLVSGDEIIAKPIFLAHASHRGDDMLASLRLVLQTVSEAFNPNVFVRVPLVSKTPAEILEIENVADIRSQVDKFWSEIIGTCCS